MQERSEATAVEERLKGAAAGLSDRGLPDDTVWAVFNATPDGIVMADEAGQILMANRQVGNCSATGGAATCSVGRWTTCCRIATPGAPGPPHALSGRAANPNDG